MPNFNPRAVLPADVANQNRSLGYLSRGRSTTAGGDKRREQRINALPDEMAKQEARKTLNDPGQ